MQRRHRWVDELIACLLEIGHPTHYTRIVDKVRERGRKDCRFLREKLREILEKHSNCSQSKDKGNGRYFYSAFGIRQGYWGLLEGVTEADGRDHSR